jgi:hypothetical protein
MGCFEAERSGPIAHAFEPLAQTSHAPIAPRRLSEEVEENDVLDVPEHVRSADR